MADSLCGPSNALQNFQKHSTADRTLQQDRLTSRNVPSQGFRSAGPSTGLLDHEFEAFQSGQIPSPHPGEITNFAPRTFQPAAPQFAQQPNSPAWANDFERLNISSPAPQFQQLQYPMQQQQQQQQKSPPNGWHEEFARQQNQNQNQSVQSRPGYNAPLERLSTIAQMPASTGAYQWPLNDQVYQQIPFQPASISYQDPQQQQLLQQQSQSQSQSQSQPQTQFPLTAEAFDEEAFARAFDAAAKQQHDHDHDQQEDLHTTATAEEAEGPQLSLDLESAISQMAPPTSASTMPREKIGADLIHDPDSTESQQQHQSNAEETTNNNQNDPDALARTAGELLERVRDNTSEKFRNSEFLGLMRRLRDEEVVVRGDRIVDVGNGVDVNAGVDAGVGGDGVGSGAGA